MSAHDPRCMGCPECDVEWGQRKRKAAIIDALRAFINQRPGFEPGNYGDAASYRSDQSTAQRQRRDALTLLRDIELRDSITADMILKEAQSGRVTLKDISAHYDDGSTMHIFKAYYCTGQYFPTEYRGAAARLCAAILWTHVREDMPPPLQGNGGNMYSGFEPGHKSPTAMHAGDWLRNHFRVMLGRTLAERYFS